MRRDERSQDELFSYFGSGAGRIGRMRPQNIVDFRAEFFNIVNRHIYLANVGGPNLATPFVPAGGPGYSGPFACRFVSITNSSGPRTIQLVCSSLMSERGPDLHIMPRSARPPQCVR